MLSINFLKAINGDCIHISFKDDTNKLRNILIDGGLDGTYYKSSTNSYGELKNTIDTIKKKRKKIEALSLWRL